MGEPAGDRVQDLFDQAVALPPPERAAFLDAACAGEPTLRAELESLLECDAGFAAGGTGGGLLKSPVVAHLPEEPATEHGGESLPSPAVRVRFGRYRVVRLLGEGGMGAVYEALQDDPRRPVALKVIRPGLASPPLLKRFVHEAQILGRLHHPGIAQIYEAGLAQDGQPFFAMELIRGEPLDEHARLRGLTVPARLELLARVCDAVHHAHEQGVIHRDLKPSNILVDEAGQPKVLDFGVARATDADLLTSTGHTRTGQLVGTLGYMSPEQVAADPARLDRRSDVYTLGVILFELLAGRRPYSLEQLSLPEVVRVIREQEPARLGALDARCRGDVETIVGKALEKEPARRYPSAAELAADIRRHLRSEPIRARPPSALYQLGKFARRHKALVATTAAFLSLLLAGGAVTAWQAVRLAHAETEQARQQAQRSHDVQAALAQAAVLREQARGASGGQGKWAEALAEARRAQARTEDGPVEPGLADQVGALLRELNEEQADRRVVARVEQVRLLQAEVDVKKKGFDLERALPEYRKVFADYGLRPGSTEPAEAGARIRRRPAEVRAAVVAALDDWLALARREDAAEASWLERVLTAADPDEWRQRVRAAWRRRDTQALLGLAREVKVATQPPQALARLGEALLADALRSGGSTEGAVELLRRAWEAHPSDFWINQNLGRALLESRPPQLDEAIPVLTAAVTLRPESPGAHVNLGNALGGKGQLDRAIARFHKAIALDPTFALAHYSLGITLRSRGDLPGAIASYRSALAIDEKLLPAHYNLGNALVAQGDMPGAAASFRRVLDLDDNQAEAHCNLGNTLLHQGNLGDALVELKKGHALGSQGKDWRYPSAQWVQRCERFLELDGRLPAILKGEAPPAGAAERLELSELCHYKGLHVTSVRLFTEAFKADGKLAADFRAGHRYRAACSAARAGCGQGEEAARLDEAARAGLRRQALQWLRADLTWVAGQLKGAAPQDRARLAAALGTWQLQPALAGVRDARPLAALPPAEWAGWKKLWADVAATQALARRGK